MTFGKQELTLCTKQPRCSFAEMSLEAFRTDQLNFRLDHRSLIFKIAFTMSLYVA